uniref:RloB-like protein n=1 Tax=Candidatus Kentrum sp. LFY TaxID=2126342 RepID=A0A450V3S3_9GAMM|nr:MAG: RloB-like protein [Candidatus Kentron sp. LFY]
MGKRRRFYRAKDSRSYRKLFLLAVEGAKTERQYFDWFRTSGDTGFVIRVECPKCNGKSSPPQVLERMKKYLEQAPLEVFDEAWLVVDKDRWTDAQLTTLHGWSQEANNYGFALSNPKFENFVYFPLIFINEFYKTLILLY